jgi:hypothetical protein
LFRSIFISASKLHQITWDLILKRCNLLFLMVAMGGIEPPTLGL